MPSGASRGLLPSGLLSFRPSAPTNKDQCKKDGWKAFNNPSFKNQGDCVSSVRRGPPRRNTALRCRRNTASSAREGAPRTAGGRPISLRGPRGPSMAAQPHGDWTRNHVLLWSGAVGVGHVVHNLAEHVAVLAFRVGHVFGLTFEPAMIRRRRKVVTGAAGPGRDDAYAGSRDTRSGRDARRRGPGGTRVRTTGRRDLAGGGVPVSADAPKNSPNGSQSRNQVLASFRRSAVSGLRAATAASAASMCCRGRPHSSTCCGRSRSGFRRGRSGPWVRKLCHLGRSATRVLSRVRAQSSGSADRHRLRCRSGLRASV